MPASGLPSATTDQTLRHNGTSWVTNTHFLANATGQITLGDATNAGTIVLQDVNGQALTLQTADFSANRSYTFPDVGANATFIMSEGIQTLNGAKTFTDNLALQPNSGDAAKQLRFYEDNANGTNYISLQAPSDILTSNYTLTLTGNYGSNNQVLSSNGSGGLFWATPAGSVPSGTDKQTLRYNNTTLEATSNLTNDGTNIGIGILNSAAKLHQDGGDATATYHKFTAGTTTGQTITDGFDVGIDATGNAVLYQNENKDININSQSVLSLKIASAGHVVINSSIVYTPNDEASVSIDVTNKSYVKISGVGTIAITGGVSGQILVIQKTGIGTATLTDGIGYKLTGNWVGSVDATLQLIFDGTDWVELSRSLN
jgi:hypothetical protein